MLLLHILAPTYSDASLWYKIAQANGLSGNKALAAGCILRMPAGLVKSTHSASTFKPYDPGEATGELSPTSPNHPLAATNIAQGKSRKHLQLVLSDRSIGTEGQEFSVLSPLTWRLGDFSAKHSLLKQGLGWGNMPQVIVARDIEEEHLAELNLPKRPGDPYTLYALWRRDTLLGPATSWLIDEFKNALVS